MKGERGRRREGHLIEGWKGLMKGGRGRRRERWSERKRKKRKEREGDVERERERDMEGRDVRGECIVEIHHVVLSLRKGKTVKVLQDWMGRAVSGGGERGEK
uniref:Uncharacterized protein n=1 Tax=Cacopsylla melanoneura TaxID=428564 RepID=A0A8D8RAM0_9HEMI